MRYFITGTAGFIGFHVAQLLIEAGHDVVGIDGMTQYYEVELKRRRHAVLLQMPHFTAHEVMLEDAARLGEIYNAAEPDVVIHLAAQAGVRYSLENPRAYVDSNLVGPFNLLKLARCHPPRHLMLASTSSVYGGNRKMPFDERDRADHALTLYAATKKATETMAHSYAHLWSIPTTVFRFFSVYGPWGRPDMALFEFTRAILADEPIELYNGGDMLRDFTYIDDLTHAIVLLAALVPHAIEDAHEADRMGLSPSGPFRVVNIGRGEPVPLLAFVEAIEWSLGKAAKRIELPMQPGDVPATFADAGLLYRLTGYSPTTPISVGVDRFVRWYRDFYAV